MNENPLTRAELRAELQFQAEQMTKLLSDIKDSLEREVHGLEREMHAGFARMDTRFDTQAQRLERHAGLIDRLAGGNADVDPSR